jgi:hypothetical protein
VIRLILFCLRSIVAVILVVVALVVILGGGRVRTDPRAGNEISGKVSVARDIGLESDWGQREALSKRKLVTRVPELGVPGHVLREEFDRRARLFRSVNPRLFDSPEWPEQLWLLMARDLSVEETPLDYPWKRDGMGSARP